MEEWAHRARRRTPSGESLFEALVTIAADAHDPVAAVGYIMRPAYLYSRHRPDRAGAEWARLEQAAIDGFKAFLRHRSAQLHIRDIDPAAELLCYLFNLMLLGPLLHGEEMRRARFGGRKRFSEGVATLAHRYLTGGEQAVGV